MSSQETEDSGQTMNLLFIVSSLSSFSYGVYLVLSTLSLRLLIKKGKSYKARRITLMYACVMLVTTTLWYFSGTYFVGIAFSGSSDSDLDGPMTLLDTVMLVVTKGASVLQFLLSDALLLFRLYMTWDRRIWIIVIPSLGYMTSLVCGILTEIAFETQLQLEPFRDIFYISTISVNAIVTGAIAYRILLMMRCTRTREPHSPLSRPRLVSVTTVFIESGVLYTISGTVVTVLIITHNNLSPLFMAILQDLTFLGPAVIILYVAMGITYENGGGTGLKECGCRKSADVESAPFAKQHA